MNFARSSLFLVTALAIASCAPSDEGEEDRAPPSPFGFELASAQTPMVSVSTSVVGIDVASLQARLASGDVRLIDVRTDEEVAQGMIPGAEHISLDMFDPAKLDQSDGREIVLYCRSGRRTMIAGEALSQYTGKPAHHLEGGILAWQESGGGIVTP